MCKKFIIIIISLFISLNINSQNVTGKWTATHYGSHYKTKRKTANGETFNMHAMTCAAPKKFKFGTKLKITNIENNKSVIVRVNDRGAFHHHNIDLTHGAFNKIAKHKDGRIKIKIQIIK